MEAASKRDEKSTSFIAKVKAIFPSPVSHQSQSNDIIAHDAEPGFQGTHKESRLCVSQIAA